MSSTFPPGSSRLKARGCIGQCLSMLKLFRLTAYAVRRHLVAGRASCHRHVLHHVARADQLPLVVERASSTSMSSSSARTCASSACDPEQVRRHTAGNPQAAVLVCLRSQGGAVDGCCQETNASAQSGQRRLSASHTPPPARLELLPPFRVDAWRTTDHTLLSLNCSRPRV